MFENMKTLERAPYVIYTDELFAVKGWLLISFGVILTSLAVLMVIRCLQAKKTNALLDKAINEK